MTLNSGDAVDQQRITLSLVKLLTLLPILCAASPAVSSDGLASGFSEGPLVRIISFSLCLKLFRQPPVKPVSFKSMD